MLQSRFHALKDVYSLCLVRGDVGREHIQDENLAPLRALVQDVEKLCNGCILEHKRFRRPSHADLSQGSDSVGNHHGVSVAKHVVQCLDEALVGHEVRRDFVELGHANGCSLANVRVAVFQSSSQRLAKVFTDLLHTNAAHGSNCKRTNDRVGVATIFHEAVDGHDSEVGLSLGVVDQVQVDEFPHLQVRGHHAINHGGEQACDVLSQCHVSDHFLYGIAFLRFIR
mmetsp:Transcript_27871/g.63054  ORF Transcript_27871/g.63054 Transcript_27871/m.63054 type:complete len:226 (+) Transcript_27871:2134-2811(+)